MSQDKFRYQVVIEGELIAPSKEVAEHTVATQITTSLVISASIGAVQVLVEPVSLIQAPSAFEAAAEISRRRGGG